MPSAEGISVQIRRNSHYRKRLRNSVTKSENLPLPIVRTYAFGHEESAFGNGGIKCRVFSACLPFGKVFCFPPGTYAPPLAFTRARDFRSVDKSKSPENPRTRRKK